MSARRIRSREPKKMNGESTNSSPSIASASQQIDAIIKKTDDWRGKRLSQLRVLIKKADSDIIEEVKWKKPSNPMGVPVWSHNGIVCTANTLKSAVRLAFPKGARLNDPKKAVQHTSR